MRSIVSRILTDRFWQAGISEGSKDEFYARVTGTRSTMEGFASSIRGSVRTVRETCYSILFSMSRMETHFYGFSELPGPLAHALFANAHFLSSHQLINLLNLVRYLVDDCPTQLREHFVPPILATCFAQVDGKISSEWERLSHKQQATTEDDDLTQEMKEESILRQLTHGAVMMVAGLLDPARTSRSLTGASFKYILTCKTDSPAGPIDAKEASTYRPDERPNAYPTMRQFCLTNPSILEPILLFCTHAIRMCDSRSCGVVLRVFRSIVPEFARTSASASDSSVREFVSTEVLKACITSLHEPYFVDLQKDLAQLIASILIYYSPLTQTPRSILLSLPGLGEKSVDQTIDYVSRVGIQPRQQRALVLDLLKDLKGVSISEQGRISKSAQTVRKERSKMQEQFMKVDDASTRRGGSPDLEGVAGMFE
jgi:exportin-5